MEIALVLILLISNGIWAFFYFKKRATVQGFNHYLKNKEEVKQLLRVLTDLNQVGEGMVSIRRVNPDHIFERV